MRLLCKITYNYVEMIYETEIYPSHTRSVCLSVCQSLNLSHTYTHTHARAHTHAPTHTHTHTNLTRNSALKLHSTFIVNIIQCLHREYNISIFAYNRALGRVVIGNVADITYIHKHVQTHTHAYTHTERSKYL